MLRIGVIRFGSGLGATGGGIFAVDDVVMVSGTGEIVVFVVSGSNGTCLVPVDADGTGGGGGGERGAGALVLVVVGFSVKCTGNIRLTDAGGRDVDSVVDEDVAQGD